jgi:hypothetical protein
MTLSSSVTDMVAHRMHADPLVPEIGAAAKLPRESQLPGCRAEVLEEQPQDRADARGT